MRVPSHTMSGHSSTTRGDKKQEEDAREGLKHQEGVWRWNDGGDHGRDGSFRGRVGHERHQRGVTHSGAGIRRRPNGVVWAVFAYNLPLVTLLLPLGRWVDVQKIIEAL